MAGETIIVNDSNELTDAFERLASGKGGTIRLEASSEPYDVYLTDRSRGQTDAPVRIVSADPDDPAVIAELSLIGRENVTIEGVVFDSSDTKRTKSHRDLEINDSRNVKVLDSAFRGDATETLDGSKGQTKGVVMALVRGSEDVELRGNTVEGYYHGIAFKDSDDVVYADNTMTKLQGDAIRVAGVQDGLIEGNHLYGMLGTAQHVNHSDMIQFWGTNIGQNTERVTVRDNIINTADGPSYQMIFGGNEDRDENGWRFEDIVIEGNLLYGAHHNMISIADTRDMTVRNNTVLWNEDAHLVERGGAEGSSVIGWVRGRNDVGTTIEGNVATKIDDPTGRNGVVTYDDPSDASHHSRHFVNLAAGGTAELQDLSLLPSSSWDGKLGAPMTWSSHKVDGVTAVVSTEVSDTDRSVITLDASLSRDEGGRLGNGASYLWTFSDGSTQRGQTVTHDFGEAGVHDYALEVREGGETDRIERTIEITDPTLLRLTTKGGKVEDASSYSSDLKVKGKVKDGGFVLDGKSKIEVDRGSEQVYSLDQFALTMSFEPEKGASGVLFTLREAMKGSISPAGAFKFTITTTEGEAEVRTKPGVFSDTKAHDLAVVYDGQEVTIYVDGVEAASAEVEGITKPREHWGLVIGNYWNKSVEGVVRDVMLSAEIDGLGADGPPLVDAAHDSADDHGGSGGGKPQKPDAKKDDDAGKNDAGKDDAGKDDDAGSGEGSGGGGKPPSSGGGKPSGPGKDGVLVHLDFDGGVSDRSGNGAEVEWDRGEVRFATGSDGKGGAVALGGRDGAVEISRSNADLFERDAFAIAFDLKPEGTGDDGGRVLSLHKTLDLRLGDDGGLRFELITDQGRAVARSDAGVVGTGWHAVELSYSSDEGVMTIAVDGEEVARTAQEGTTAEAKHWGLTLGRPWGGEAKALVDEFVFAGEAGGKGGAPAPSSPAQRPDPEPASDPSPKPAQGAEKGATLVALDFERDLSDADGRSVKVHADGPVGYSKGTDGRGVRIGEGSVEIARSNAFLHERDSFEFTFDLKRDGASEDGRVLHLHRAIEAWVAEDGTMDVILRTDEGTFRAETEKGAVSGRGWHEVAFGYDDAAGLMRLTVDGESVEASASGTTAKGSHHRQGFALGPEPGLGSAWGDTLGATIDSFRMSDAPDWA